MDDLDSVYPLGGINGSIPTQDNIDYLKCGVRYTPTEVSNGHFIVYYNNEFHRVTTLDFGFKLLSDNLPIGTVLDYTGDTPPLGWAVLDGSSFNPLTYPELTNLLGSNTLPNFSGRSCSTISDPFNENVGDLKGTSLKVINQNNIPTHSHVYIDSVRGSDGENDGGSGNAGTSPNVISVETNTDSAGGEERMENVQPTILYNKIIKAVPTSNENTEFIPLDASEIFTETGIEFLPFCQREGSVVDVDTPDPYVPTYNLDNCVSSVDIGISSVLGLSSTTITESDNTYTGFAGVDNDVPPNPIFLRIEEMENSYWSLLYIVGGFNTSIMTSSTDFPACPTDATWVTPFDFENETLTVDFVIPTP